MRGTRVLLSLCATRICWAPGALTPCSCFQIDVQLYIMSFLTPQDLCRLGCTSCYWRVAVQDPLLWRNFLLRDLPIWTSVDWKSLPATEIFNKAFSQGSDEAMYDYMAV